MVDVALGVLLPIFTELEVLAEIIIPTSLYPLDIEPILNSVQQTGKLVTMEECSGFCGIGGEIIAQVCEMGDFTFTAKRVAALPVPIPSAKSLETAVLPGTDMILEAVRKIL